MLLVPVVAAAAAAWAAVTCPPTLLDGAFVERSCMRNGFFCDVLGDARRSALGLCPGLSCLRGEGHDEASSSESASSGTTSSKGLGLCSSAGVGCAALAVVSRAGWAEPTTTGSAAPLGDAAEITSRGDAPDDRAAAIVRTSDRLGASPKCFGTAPTWQRRRPVPPSRRGSGPSDAGTLDERL